MAIAVTTAVFTAALVLITLHYARSTAAIADETARAAHGARVTAQVGLLQSLLAVQPLLEFSGVAVERWRGRAGGSGSAGGIPIRIEWEVRNIGSGVAFNPVFDARLGDVSLRPTEETPPVQQVVSGETVRLVHQAERGQLSALDFGPDASGVPGSLRVRCKDCYGAAVALDAELTFDGEVTTIVSTARSYENGEELRVLLKKLLDGLLEKAPHSKTEQPQRPDGGASRSL